MSWFNKEARREGAGMEVACLRPRAPRLIGSVLATVLCASMALSLGSVSFAYAEDAPSAPAGDTSSAPAADAPSIAEGTQIRLRQSGDVVNVNVSLEGMTAGWAEAVTGISVQPCDYGIGNPMGEAVTLQDTQYSLDADRGRISFVRTEDNPIFEVETGKNPIEISGRWGNITYPQSAKYQITVTADGYADVTGVVTFYTGTAPTFSIIVVDENGTESVKAVWTAEELAQLDGYAFQNGSSQCGMTGFRTFSGYGVSLDTLLEKAGVTVSPSDSFLIQTSDEYGNHQTYESLFGSDRYFLKSIYDDQEVKDTYARLVASDDEAGALIELRKLLAAKALEDGSTVEPMISTGYAETLISGDEVASAVLPTEGNTDVNSLVGLENQFRFIYGIRIVQEDCTVSFSTGDGSEVASQTVLSNPMTSTENTTMWSSYWANALYIYRGGAEAAEPASAAAEKLEKPADPVREGYTFAGWYTDEACTEGNEFDFAANNGTVDADITLYAKWVEGSVADGGASSDDAAGDGNDAAAGDGNGTAAGDNGAAAGDGNGTAAGDNGSSVNGAGNTTASTASGNQNTLSTTGDTVPVASVVCFAGASALLATLAVVARRRDAVQ